MTTEPKSNAEQVKDHNSEWPKKPVVPLDGPQNAVEGTINGISHLATRVVYGKEAAQEEARADKERKQAHKEYQAEKPRFDREEGLERLKKKKEAKEAAEAQK